MIIIHNIKELKLYKDLICSFPKTELDYIEMILDWESARYTKDDKPLNAYDTLNRFYPHLQEVILLILEKINLAFSTAGKDERVVEYAKTLENTSIEDIREELINYVNGFVSKNHSKI